MIASARTRLTPNGPLFRLSLYGAYLCKHIYLSHFLLLEHTFVQAVAATFSITVSPETGSVSRNNHGTDICGIN